MSLAVARILCGTASKLINRQALSSAALQTFKPNYALDLTANATKFPNAFTRSLWSLSTNADHKSQLTKRVGSTKLCGCCGLHTEGDRELGEFLVEELELEKKSQKNKGSLPEINGFQVTKTDGCEISLTKKSGNETVTVWWNVNNSIDEEIDEGTGEGEEGSQLEMVSKPEFVVEIQKGSGKTLSIELTIPHNADLDPEAEGLDEEGGAYEDIIQISEVALVDGPDWDEKTFSLAGAVMDGDLYDMFLRLLEERGVDEAFVSQLVNFSTVYEQNQYLKFLKELKKFAETD